MNIKGWVCAPLGVAACLVLPSCGAIVDRAVEEVAEEATGIEIDEDGGTITLEGSDGSVVINTDEESMTIESDEGDIEVTTDGEDGVTIQGDGFDENGEDTEINITSNNELPEGLDIPVPDGGTVMQSTSFREGEEELYQVLVNYPASDYDRVAGFYEDYFDGVDGVNRIEVNSTDGRGFTFTTEQLLLTVGEDAENTVIYLQTIGG